MGYSARYHAASLAAVFLALAIGILIGVGFGSDIVTGTADDLEQSLHPDLDDARGGDRRSAGRARDRARLRPGGVPRRSSAAGSAAQRDRRWSPWAASIPGSRTRVENAIEPRGRQARRGRGRPRAARPERARSTADRRDARADRAGRRGGAAPARRARRPPARPRRRRLRRAPRDAAQSRTAASRATSTRVVVARARPARHGPRRARRPTDQIEQGMVAGLDSVSTAVGAERTDTGPVVDRLLRGPRHPQRRQRRPRLRAGGAGLRARRRPQGSFGVKDTADGLLPDLLSPSGQATGSAGVGGELRCSRASSSRRSSPRSRCPPWLRDMLRAGWPASNYRGRRVAFPLGAVLVTCALVALAPLAFLNDRADLDLLDPGAAALDALPARASPSSASSTTRSGAARPPTRRAAGAATPGRCAQGSFSTGAIKAIGALALAAYVVSGPRPASRGATSPTSRC